MDGGPSTGPDRLNLSYIPHSAHFSAPDTFQRAGRARIDPLRDCRWAQRIRALADFRSDKFPLLEASDKKLRLPNSLRNLPAPWGKRRFSDLDDQLRSELRSKEIDVFVISELVDPDE